MVISTHKLSYSISNRKILNCICLNIKKNEYVAITGENGCGKTTLFKLLLNQIKPTSGTIRINGIDINNFNDWRKIGYLSQFSKLPNLPITAKELIVIGYKQNNNLYHDNLNTLIETLDLSELLNKQFNILSGGQKQRILLARSLINDPDILLLDEPTNGLDPKIRTEILNYLNIIHKKTNISILHITHDINRIRNDVDRIVCISSQGIHNEQKNIEHVHHD